MWGGGGGGFIDGICHVLKISMADSNGQLGISTPLTFCFSCNILASGLCCNFFSSPLLFFCGECGDFLVFEAITYFFVQSPCDFIHCNTFIFIFYFF